MQTKIRSFVILCIAMAVFESVLANNTEELLIQAVHKIESTFWFFCSLYFGLIYNPEIIHFKRQHKE